MKKIGYLLTIIMLLIGIGPVFADTNSIVDFSKKGNVTITLSTGDGTGVVKDAEIKIYKLADAYSENSNLSFAYHEEIDKYKDSIKNNDLNEEILNCIYNSDIITRTGITNDLGYISFDNLDLGLYLIEQTNQIEGYSKIDPFLVAIPKEINHKWTYDIEASPKTDITRLFDITVEKRWDSINSESTPESVTIELLKNGEVIDTIILNNENNWTHTWTQIEKSDEYSVREKNIPAGYTATYRQVENKFIVTNTKTLVQTGQNILIIELLAVMGITFIIAGIICEKRKKHD